MLIKQPGFIAQALVCVLLAAGITEVRAAPNTFNTALPVAKGQYLWREQLVIRERSSEGPASRDVSVRTLGNVLGYGVTPEFAVFGAVPYFFDKALEVTTPSGRIKRSAAGVGDISLFGRYTLYRRDLTGSTFRVAPLFGLTVPSGDHSAGDQFGQLPRPLQTGTGAWAGFGGVVATFQSLGYQIDGQLLYRENGRHDGFALGDLTRLDGSLQYRIWPSSMRGVSGSPAFVYALLESNLSYQERNETGRSTDPDSGGMQWLLAPGLQYVSRRWIVEGTIQLPVADAANGNAIQDDYVVRFGFRRNF